MTPIQWLTLGQVAECTNFDHQQAAYEGDDANVKQ